MSSFTPSPWFYPVRLGHTPPPRFIIRPLHPWFPFVRLSHTLVKLGHTTPPWFHVVRLSHTPSPHGFLLRYSSKLLLPWFILRDLWSTHPVSSLRLNHTPSPWLFLWAHHSSPSNVYFHQPFQDSALPVFILVYRLTWVIINYENCYWDATSMREVLWLCTLVVMSTSSTHSLSSLIPKFLHDNFHL